ncbi:MAG TPA: LLM class flavin-dependent oxidoreductase [Nitrososphaera sp.]|jgi:probable F420-dependent oxidoreductase
MRAGYSLGPLLSVEEVQKCASLADAHGADSVWVPESWGRESFSTLGALAHATDKVRLGTSITSIFARTPATIAMGAATLDALSDGRCIIGLGTSTEAIVESWHGVKFERPASRMKEYVECIKLMMSGEKVNYAGEFFKVSNFKMLNAPKRQVPVFLAAVNKRMLALAAEKADGVLLYMRPLQELRETTAWLKASAGAKFEVALSLICAVSDGEPEKARERAAKTLAFYIAVGKYYRDFLAENGYHKETEKIAEEYKKNGGDAAGRQVPREMLDALTVCGTKQECRKALARFVDAGVTLPILQVNPVEGAESSFRDMLSTF